MAKRKTIVIENNNEFIAEYLDAYLAMKEIDFAVMISGPWGCGKTHFINQYLSKRRKLLASPDQNLFWYVSLHGVANCAEIDLRLYEAAHPVVGNGNVKLVGHLVRGLVEAGLEIGCQVNAGSVGKAFDASKRLYNKLVKLYDGKKKPSLIVFDDFERSRLDKTVLLGYMCDLLQAQVPIVILGAENEIESSLKKDEDGIKPYHRIREKVIGRTFHLQDELKDLFRLLVGAGIYENAQDFLKSEYVNIVNDLRKGRDDNWQCNYRALKHTFRLLDYILGGIKRHGNVWQNEAFMKSFTRVFVVIGYETQVGTFNEKDFEFKFDVLLNENAEKNRLVEFLNDHGYGSQLNLLGQPSLLLPFNDFKDIFFGYKSDRNKIAESIASLPLFARDKIDDWYLFWQWPRLDDNQASEICSTVLKGLDEYKYTKAGEIVHIFTILCSLSQNKCISDTIPALKKKFKTYITKIDDDGALMISDNWRYLANDSWGSCAYWRINSCKKQPSQFFVDYISTLAREKEALAKSKEKADLFRSFSEHPDRLHEELMNATHLNRPILQDVNTEDFFNEFLKSSNAVRLDVCHVFQYRFKDRFNPETFKAEKKFATDLTGLARHWIKEYKAKSKTPSFFTVNRLKGVLEDVLASVKKEPNKKIS